MFCPSSATGIYQIKKSTGDSVEFRSPVRAARSWQQPGPGMVMSICGHNTFTLSWPGGVCAFTGQPRVARLGSEPLWEPVGLLDYLLADGAPFRRRLIANLRLSPYSWASLCCQYVAFQRRTGISDAGAAGRPRVSVFHSQLGSGTTWRRSWSLSGALSGAGFGRGFCSLALVRCLVELRVARCLSFSVGAGD
jgi:hypothetical protein